MQVRLFGQSRIKIGGKNEKQQTPGNLFCLF